MLDFGKAIASDMKHRADSNALNKALLETLPEEPERGSYYWWARKCRENTGQHFLDNGIAYGYSYNAPVRPEDADAVTVHFYNGELEYPSIHLPHFLHAMFDAEDETATILEKRLYTIADTMPRESWYDVVRAFLDALEGYEVHERGYNTYNYDDDLDQVFQAEAILVDGYDEYHILRIHTGCDVCGGYTSPVIVLARDSDYVWFRQCDFRCHECYADWDSHYEYRDALNRLEFEGPIAVIETDDGERHPDEDGPDSAPAMRTRLYCLKCGKYSVGVYNMAYGF